MSDQQIRAAIARFVDRAFAALEQTDYYRVLGVSSAASEEEIRTAYYRLAARLHPDIHGEGGDPGFRAKLTAVFSRVVEAYKVLSHATHRGEYDQVLSRGQMRLSAGVRIKKREDVDDISDANARKFFQLAKKSMDQGNARSAIMNIRIAMSSEPDNELLKKTLERAERMAKGRRP